MLQAHRIRRLDAVALHAELRAPTAPLAPGSAEAAEAHVRLLVKRMGVVNEQLAEACGTAPVTRRSGKSLIVVRRLATHNRLRDAVYHWARVAAQRDPRSKAKYQELRARGHGHARALRSVADRLLKVACAMLRDGILFDPQRYGAPA